MERNFIAIEDFSDRCHLSLGAYGAILHELGKSENGMVSKRFVQRKYRTFKKKDLEGAAMALKMENRIEIVRDISGNGRPPTFFRSK